jgi:phosphatidylglycerol---prolipoprotein diacylglyceryl transferase
MRPTLFSIGAFSISSYGFFVFLSFVVVYFVRKREQARLNYSKDPRQRYVGLGALIGAIVGAKLGMLLFEPPEAFAQTLAKIVSVDFSGKTVVGGIAGGYLGVELAKKLVGITTSTGDAFAIALPLSQGIGRLGCFFYGCCYGTETTSCVGVTMLGASRHPVQLYEAALDLSLGLALFVIREGPRPAGHLFRRYLVGYALIRVFCEFYRGDPAVYWGPFKLVQVFCLFFAVVFLLLIVKEERAT